MDLADYASLQPSYSTKSAWRVSRNVKPSRLGRNRKGAKARTWTDNEERILVEGRNQRTPYKRLAATLQKSELACRLHYHQLTKHRPSIDIEMCDADDYDDSLRSYPRPSPSVASNVTPPTTYGGMDQLKLPSVAALLHATAPSHQRSVSLPGSLTVPVAQSQRQLTPPPYILPPPRRLLSPFEEATILQNQRYHLPEPVQPCIHHGHHRSLSSQASVSFTEAHRPLASDGFHFSPQTSPMMTYKLAPPPSLGSHVGQYGICTF